MTACCITTISLACSLSLSVERWESLHHKETPRDARKCMCGGDDHLAWKHPVSLEACRGLRTTGGDEYQIEYIWALLLRTCQLIPTESHSYRTLSSVSIFVGGFTLTDLDSLLWIRVEVTVDQFAAAMASIQEAIANLGQRIDGQQTQQTEVAPFPITLPIPTSEDPHTRMDKLEQRPPAPSRPITPTYLHPVSQPAFVTHVIERPPALYTRPRALQTTTYGPGHDTDHCNALRHAIQDLIDQSLVNLGQPSVTTNPLPAHSTHAVLPSPRDIHHMDLIEDDSIHMLSWDDGLPEQIVLHDSYEIDGVSLEDDDSEGREIQIVTCNGKIAQLLPLVVRPFEGAASHEEIRVETTTTPKRLIHMMKADRATCIVFSDDDLPLEGSDHVRPLYITVGCSSHRVPSVLLDNDSALNVCPLATTVTLGFAPSDFGPFAQTGRAYDSTKREVVVPW
ncbi:hypothetical protein CK203_054284 [Vitis vinifera]|uniref:Uncharacterized protein n=1 Tax=Vitis vinifera TaxID=29760 RepID=A0A438GY35_VITVI|nr:hypothetical protein CK203_054284 [Vitis vinifera]